MSEFLRSYLTVAFVGLSVVVFAVGTMTVGRTIRPNNPSEAKRTAYESGADPVDGNWDQSHVRYYLYALLFVVFDVEVAFIIPWAVQVESLSTFGLIEMLVFVAVLTLGLAYAWRKRVLKWD